MRKIIIGLVASALITSMAGLAQATLITFDLDPTGSSVTNPGGAVTTSKIIGPTGLGVDNFSLEVGETMEIDFFALTTTRRARGLYNIEATLAFFEPIIGSADGTGGLNVPSLFGTTENCFPNIFGKLVGGTLTWDPLTIPDIFTLQDGTKISIDFQQGVRVPLGRTTTIHAYITNVSGPTVAPTATPVPEPATLVLLGIGLLGLAAAHRRRVGRA